MTHEHRIAIPMPTTKDMEYNRRSWPMYAAAVEQAGGVAVVVDLTQREAEIAAVARGCQGVLLPGSPADVDPRRYGREAVAECAPADLPRERADWLLLEEAYSCGKPVLGICYGVQSLNTWRGGTLIQDLSCRPVNHSAGGSVAIAHSASIESTGILRGMVDPSEGAQKAGEMRLPINSSHHQAIEQPGEGLIVAAVSSEDGVIEAVEGTLNAAAPSFVLGVQWHPERSVAISGTSRAIFRGFIEAVAAWEQLQRSQRAE